MLGTGLPPARALGPLANGVSCSAPTGCLPRLVLPRNRSEGPNNHKAWDPDISTLSVRCALSDNGSSDFILKPAKRGEQGSVAVSYTKTCESTRLSQTCAELENLCGGALACEGDCLLAKVVRLRAWAAPMVGGGLRLTAAAPGADLSLRRLLRQSLLAGGAQLPQACCCPQAGPHNRAGHACQQVHSGLVTMDRTRRLLCLGSDHPDAGGPMPCVGIWISGILSLQDAHLWATGMDFLLSRASIEKTLQPDMAFLVVVFMPGGESVYEAVPRLRKDMRLPVWAFSARARHAPGGAPAVVCLSQPKLQPAGIQVKTGQHRHQDLLQRVLHSEPSGNTSNRQHGPAVPDTAMRPESASEDVPRHCAEEVLSRTCKEASAPTAALGESAPITDDRGAAQHACGCPDSRKMLCSDLQPQEPIAVQPFQRQQDGPAADCHLSTVRPMHGEAYQDAPQQDPQLDALLHDVQAQPSGVPLAPWCAQNWQALAASPADSDSSSSDQQHIPFRPPMLAKEHCLAERNHRSEVQAMPPACLLEAPQDPQPGREGLELRAQETCGAKHSRADTSSHEAAGAAETRQHLGRPATRQSLLHLLPREMNGEDIQGPSTPAGRPGSDSAQQEGGKRTQQHGTASLLLQGVTSLRGQLRHLKEQLQEEVLQASPVSELENRACEGLPHGPHLLTCQKQNTYEGQHSPNVMQDTARELCDSEDHMCSSAQATWPQHSEKMCAHEGGHPNNSRAGKGSLRQLSREASTGSAISSYSAERLAAARESVMCESSTQANRNQLLLLGDPPNPADDAQHVMQLNHSDTNCSAADSREPGQSEAASGVLPNLRTLQIGSHPGAVSAASSGSLIKACPASASGYLDSCDDMETGVEQGAAGPVPSWLRWFSQAGTVPSEPSFNGSVSAVSNSDDEDELSRLEAKYGICRTQSDRA